MRPQITFHIITLFPDALMPYLDASIIGRARREGVIRVLFYNPRDFVNNVHAGSEKSTRMKDTHVDRRPYGGGPGMVLQPEPFIRAVEKARGRKKNAPVLFFSCDGKQFDASYARKLAHHAKHLILIAGHYEGVDARVRKALKATALSIGPYVLTGGELPALVVIDALSRQVPGVLGTYESLEEERISSSEVYTRPEVFTYRGKKYRVPKVLLSGNHKNIEAWKKKH